MKKKSTSRLRFDTAKRDKLMQELRDSIKMLNEELSIYEEQDREEYLEATRIKLRRYIGKCYIGKLSPMSDEIYIYIKNVSDDLTAECLVLSENGIELCWKRDIFRPVRMYKAMTQQDYCNSRMLIDEFRKIKKEKFIEIYEKRKIEIDSVVDEIIRI